MLERQELQQKIKIFCSIRGSPDHWLNSGVSQRIEVQKALGNHLSSKDRYKTYDFCHLHSMKFLFLSTTK